VAENLSYEDFESNYFCKRFSILADIKTIFSGPAQFGDFEFMEILNTSNAVLHGLIINATDVGVKHKIYIDGQYVGNLCVNTTAKESCRLDAKIDVSKNSTVRIERARLANGSNDDYVISYVDVIFRLDTEAEEESSSSE